MTIALAIFASISRRMPSKQKGFTLVELLVVIVVIAILAAITIVAYNGIQARAKDSSVASSIDSLRHAIELYYVDNGIYPAFCTTDNTGCIITTPIATEVSMLTPQYVNSVPSFVQRVDYVRGSNGVSYGIEAYYNSGTCKYLSQNGSTGWWGVSTPVCS